jgi:hypothetical protein
MAKKRRAFGSSPAEHRAAIADLKKRYDSVYQVFSSALDQGDCYRAQAALRDASRYVTQIEVHKKAAGERPVYGGDVDHMERLFDRYCACRPVAQFAKRRR